MSKKMPPGDIGDDQSRSLLAAIVESSDDAIVSKDLNGIITSWNAGAEAIFGYKPEEIIGKSILTIIPDDRRDEETEIISRIRRGERVKHFDTIRRRKDGTLIPISLTISPIRDDDGQIVGASKIARDISERRRLEEAQRTLSREINHRSKNLLAVVQSIVRYTAAHSPPQDLTRRIGQRLQALSANQDLLIESAWRGAGMRQLVITQLQHVEELPIERVALTGEDVFLLPAAAQALGLALHELATNAVRFGALTGASGTVALSWRLQGSGDARELVVSWQEAGGPAVTTPEYAGFGTTIIKRITGQSMGGVVTTTFAPTGLAWEVRAPARGLVGDTDGMAANGVVK